MKKEEDEDEGIVISPGSRLRITSLESRDNPLITHGIFIGYTAIAHDEGLCIKLDESHKELAGKLRIIPVHVIVSIDVVETVDTEEKESLGSSTMFG